MPSGFGGHRSEGDRVALRLDGRDAVFPDLPRGSRHHVDRTRPGLQSEPFPPGVSRSSKSKIAGRAQRQAEYPVELRLVPVPPDADTDAVLGAKNLANLGPWAAESFDLLDYRAQPPRDRIGNLEPAQAVVVSESERGHATLSFVLAELERLQRQSRDLSDQDLLGLRRDELFGISQPFGAKRPVGKETELLGQAGLPSVNLGDRYMGSRGCLRNVRS
jgi:hypothetical protein